LAKLAARVMAGQSLAEIGFVQQPHIEGFFVKEAVLPFQKFPGVDARLSPEMRSTGEVMGHAAHFGHAFAKAQTAAGNDLPQSGTIFISVNDFDKGAAMKVARDLYNMGFAITATRGTAAMLQRIGVPAQPVNKVSEGSPHIVEAIQHGEISLIINTPLGPAAHSDGKAIRMAAARLGVPLLTTLSATAAAVNGIKAVKAKGLTVRSLQVHHGE
jgi:carbamoyl-phosphate synthase large subunit